MLNRGVMEAFMYRCHPQTRRLAELVRTGAIGEVRMIRTVFSYQGRFDPGSRTVGNALGGFVMAALADRWPVRRLLVLLPLLSALVLAGLAASDSGGLAVAGLAAVGFCYGAIIAVYPVATANCYGPDLAARAYGRVFIAWGLAGLGGPWIAGAIYDAGQSYGPALTLAAAAALLSAGLARSLSLRVNGATG